MNRIKENSIYSLHVPELYNPTIAYLVPCSYADAFLRTPRNFKGKRQLLDKMAQPLAFYSQSYQIKSGFLMKEKLKRLVDGLMENGIRKHWVAKLVKEKMDEDLKKKELFLKMEESSFLELKNMTFPFLILIAGCIMGSSSFLVEQFIKSFRAKFETLYLKSDKPNKSKILQ